jgi:acetate kinase
MAVSHRVVHGGERLVASCLIDRDVEDEIERLSPLAPLHNPVALRWIRACREALCPAVAQVAVFDTAFYADMPDAARLYALPRELCRRLEIWRYGFHGTAHRAMWRRWAELRPDLKGGGRAISLQLGAGSSMTAVRGGRAVDTSMGFSPLEGLVMATRPGDIDPGLCLYLQRAGGLSAEEVEALLNRSSGLKGLAGEGAMEALLKRDDPEARAAVDLYCYRARKYLGAYLSVLGGADAVLFGGGVGENAPYRRERILEGMGWLGIELDEDANASAVGVERRVSASGSRTEVWAMKVDEASQLAMEAVEVLGC